MEKEHSVSCRDLENARMAQHETCCLQGLEPLPGGGCLVGVIRCKLNC